ncbi:MAG: YeeE/YedE family protein [Gammaproteobacteria bacterium]|nr:YeeE/YedE family protein [Gammaproteobacteria bacterium]
MEYLTWWKGALALGGLTVVCALMVGRMLGVSGAWANVVNWREEREKRKTAAALRSNAPAMQNALLAATLAQFGETATHQAFANQGITLPAQAATRATPTSGVRWTAHLTFLAAMVLGGFIAAIASGQFQIRLDLGAAHTRLFGTGIQEWLTLLGGGILVGFGTQMGGGCTSGHGLSGVSRLTPPSMLATAMFFGSAVAVSFIVEGFA